MFLFTHRSNPSFFITMYFLFKKSERSLSLLLILSVFLSLALPLTLPLPARAYVPTDVCSGTDNLCFKEVSATGCLTSLSGVLGCVTSAATAATSFDAIGTMLVKTVITTLRDVVIQYIQTGRFSKPSFVQSFMLDPQNMAEIAARIFLSDLTGINFCGGMKSITTNLSFSLNLGFNLQCAMRNADDSDRLLSQMIRSPETIDPVDYALWLHQSNDYVQTAYTAAGKKLEYEARAMLERSAEAITGKGFLGIRDEATGKVMTPGEIVAQPLMETIANDWGNLETAREMSDAIAAIINVIFQTTFEKIITGGLAI